MSAADYVWLAEHFVWPFVIVALVVGVIAALRHRRQLPPQAVVRCPQCGLVGLVDAWRRS